MTDKPVLTPQTFAKRGSPVTPSLSQQAPSLRGVPSVTQFAEDSIAETYINLADDAGRLQEVSNRRFNLSNEQFIQVQNEVKERQLLENEGVAAEASIMWERKKSDLRQSTGNTDAIPSKTLEAYDELTASVLENNDLSEFQKRDITQRFKQNRVKVAQQALEYQESLRQLEKQNNIAKAQTARSMRVANNPSLLVDELEQAREDYQKFGMRGAALEKQLASDKMSLTKLAVQSGLSNENTRGEYTRLLEEGAFDEGIDGATKLSWLSDIETEANKAERDAEDARDDARKLRAEQAQVQILQASDPSIPEDQRPPMPTRQEITAMDLSLVQREKLLALKADEGVDNPQFISDINRMSRERPLEALDALDIALSRREISNATFNRMESRINNNLEAGGRISVLERSVRTIEGLENEATLNELPAISININNATEELNLRVDEFDQRNEQLGRDIAPQERNEFIRRETLAVIKENFPAQIFELSTQIPLPSSDYYSGKRQDMNADALKEVKRKLAKDFKAGRIVRSRLERETRKITQWEAHLKFKEQMDDTINSLR